jgi:predicted RNA-binding Zn-ribbon protein involved in translation (DUF1610 family)
MREYLTGPQAIERLSMFTCDHCGHHIAGDEECIEAEESPHGGRMYIIRCLKCGTSWTLEPVAHGQ